MTPSSRRRFRILARFRASVQASFRWGQLSGVKNVNQPTYAAEWKPSFQQPYASWYPPYFPPLMPPTTQQLPARELNSNAPAFKADKVITSAVTPTKGTSRVRPGCWNCGNLGHSFRYCQLVRKAFCHRCGEPDQNAYTCTACASPVSGKGVMGPDNWVRAAPKRAERTPRVTSKITGDYSLCSEGLDMRLFIYIKFNGKIVRALFDPGSCCTYLGK